MIAPDARGGLSASIRTATVRRRMDLTARFHALTALLRETRDVWHARPFVECPPAWHADRPDIARFAEWLDPDVPDWHAAPDDVRAWREAAIRLTELPDLAPPSASARPIGSPPPEERFIPGRKWRQIHAFAAALADGLPPPDQLVDWCGGKGHLGRVLSRRTGASVRVVERDVALCAAGARLAERAGVDLEFVAADALALAPSTLTGATVAALHACGDLHGTLVERAVVGDATAVAIAPCCHNRISAEFHVPMSAVGRAAALRLDRADLGMPAREDVVASTRDRRARRQNRAWRLAFDILQREGSGEDVYRAVRPLPVTWLRLPFVEYCHRVAELEDLALPSRFDPEAVEAAGWARLGRVRAYDCVRMIFARPLELWLVLDRALALSDAGWRIAVGAFCPRATTPRNLMILATRS